MAKATETVFVSFDDIVSAQDREIIVEDVPEWGGSVRLMTMTGDERDEFESGIAAKKDGEMNLKGMRASLVGKCLVDADGKRIFSDDESRFKLGQKSAKVLSRLFTACAKLNGITKEDEAELVENFSEDQNERSTSD